MSHDTGAIGEADELASVLSNKALQNLGLIAYWAAWVESCLHHVAERWAASDRESAHLLVKGKTAGQVADLMRVMAGTPRVANDPRGAEVAAAISAAKAAMDRRNQILHSAIGGAFEEGHVALYKKDQSPPRIIAEGELMSTAMSLRAAARLLVDVM